MSFLVCQWREIDEPAADLCTALAIASSFKEQPVHEQVVLVGEVGLTGEVRAVAGMEKRLQEAAKLGFKVCIGPKDKQSQSMGIIEYIGVQSLQEAVEAAIER